MKSEGAPGLQAERTALAWSRTAFSLLAAAAAISRLTYHDFGIWSMACLALTLPLAIWVFSQCRPREVHADGPRDIASNRVGLVALSVSAMTVIVGATQLVAVLR